MKHRSIFSLTFVSLALWIGGLSTLPAQADNAEAETRTWTDSTGQHKTEAAFVSATAQAVTLRMADGRILNVPLARLSAEDQAYARQQITPGSSAGATTTSTGGDWPCWRGPNRDGKVDPADAQLDWDANPPKEAWRKEIGSGYSAFAVADGKVYTMGHQDGEDVVWCLNPKDGSEVWAHKYSAKSHGNSYPGPRGTPSVEEGRIYIFGSDAQVHCLDASSGKVHWSQALESDLDTKRPSWWYASSPVIAGDLVLLNLGTSGVALDKASGKVKWEKGTDKCGYASPVPSPSGDELAIFAKDNLYLCDLSSGKVKWGTGWQTEHDVNAADPIFIGDKIFITSGYGHGCAMLGTSNGKIEWENKSMCSQTVSPILHNDYIYGANGNVGRGKLVCMDPKDGSVKWSEDLKVGGLLLAGDMLIVQSGNGQLSVVKASPEAFELVGQTKVLGGTCWTMPVLAGGMLYSRNKEGEMAALDLR